ncbi:MAG: hypothetical protein WKF58_17250 [Ilumatobacteraceae bacterium]
MSRETIDECRGVRVDPVHVFDHEDGGTLEQPPLECLEHRLVEIEISVVGDAELRAQRRRRVVRAVDGTGLRTDDGDVRGTDVAGCHAVRAGDELVDETGLADAGFTRDESDVRLAAGRRHLRRLDEPDETCQWADPTDHHTAHTAARPRGGPAAGRDVRSARHESYGTGRVRPTIWVFTAWWAAVNTSWGIRSRAAQAASGSPLRRTRRARRRRLACARRSSWWSRASSMYWSGCILR